MNRSNHGKYLELREKYPSFVFPQYKISESGNALCLDFFFEIPGLAEFTPHWEIPKLSSLNIDVNDERLNELVFSLGMVELASYLKLTCSPEVRVECGSLNEEQAAWWKKLYKKGLGEFFYTNGIEVDEDFVNISGLQSLVNPQRTRSARPYGYNNTDPQANKDTHHPKVLIPIGGGKDSAVTLELLRGHADRYCYIINSSKASLDTVIKGGVPLDKLITAKRTLDENMLALNREGFLNGHTPFSALVAFSSVIAAYVHGIGYVALSNESSAAEPTVSGTDINHQYTKSFEFEADFIDYEAKYISSGVKYFSLLRPLTELAIARIFSRFEQYHNVFRSCNAGSKEGIWCAECPKCLFVYIILSAFLPKSGMVDIFGRDMLDDMELLPIFGKLIGAEPEKPFECVGSREEVNAAMGEIIRQSEADGTTLTALVNYYKDLNIADKYDFIDICNRFDENHFIPREFVDVVKGAVRESRIC